MKFYVTESARLEGGGGDYAQLRTAVSLFSNNIIPVFINDGLIYKSVVKLKD